MNIEKRTSEIENQKFENRNSETEDVTQDVLRSRPANKKGQGEHQAYGRSEDRVQVPRLKGQVPPAPIGNTYPGNPLVRWAYANPNPNQIAA